MRPCWPAEGHIFIPVQWEGPESFQAEERHGQLVMLEEQRAVGRGRDQGDFSVVLIAATSDLNKGGRSGDGER